MVKRFKLSQSGLFQRSTREILEEMRDTTKILLSICILMAVMGAVLFLFGYVYLLLGVSAVLTLLMVFDFISLFDKKQEKRFMSCLKEKAMVVGLEARL